MFGLCSISLIAEPTMTEHEQAHRDPEDVERRRVADEISTRLRSRGVHLTGHESSDELARLLEAVEQFEAAVEHSGGDLMVDEPVRGDTPTEPDNRAFVLPRRRDDESVTRYIDRIVDATANAGRRR